MSRSSLYQRRDIPRYRRPGSRIMLFDQDELETLLKQGRIEGFSHAPGTGLSTQDPQTQTEGGPRAVDIQAGRVYHRNHRYR